jgi:Zn-dependent protease with chaperone function/uncharacterized tellurite resistance protein B-like protein
MDFFGHQARARSASGRLVLLFALAVAAIVGCIYLLAHVTLVVVEERNRGFDPAVFAVVALATLGIVGVAMLFKTSQLRSGGGKVARLLGGTPVPPSPSDPKLRMLRNLVEEMAIASGTPMPEIYVLEGEAGINAFAAGWGTADAAVAVTRGCLDELDRDELQGVIAHEFSHIFHGDMRLNIRLIGVLFGIVCISTIGRILLRAAPRGRGDRKGGAAAFVAFGLGLVVIGSLGVLFARLIQAAISRQREYLADASAVQYTRNPRGIGMALAKIGGLTGRLRSPHAEEASHMFFADGVARLFGGAFATHPPLADRVERVLPGFQRQLRNAPSMAAAAAATPLPPGFAAANAPAPPRALPAAALVASIGNPQPMHVDAARALLRALPPALAAAAREPVAAKALVAALLLDRDPQVRRAQLALLPADNAAFGLAVRDQLRQLKDADPRLRLPLAEMSAPALRTLPAAERRALRGVLRALADADAGMSTFEWALLRILERHAHLEDGSAPRVRRRSEPLTEHAREAALVLSALAHAGAAGDPERAAAAFARGLDAAQLPADTALLPPGQCGAAALDRAVLALDEVLPTDQRRLLHGCAEAAAADGSLDAAEVDLLRALAALWDCPIPLAP